MGFTQASVTFIKTIEKITHILITIAFYRWRETENFLSMNLLQSFLITEAENKFKVFQLNWYQEIN